MAEAGDRAPADSAGGIGRWIGIVLQGAILGILLFGATLALLVMQSSARVFRYENF